MTYYIIERRNYQNHICPNNIKEETIISAKPLSVIDGKRLLGLDIEPPRFIVSRLMPVGLHILSGSPKVGKSWFALWLCQQVSRGKPVWEFETQQSTVLYLALEDTISRLHSRLSSITEDSSEQSFFTTEASNLSDGLIQQLEKFIEDNPTTGLVIIDTLQRVRSSSGGDKTLYALDYSEMNQLKHLADENGIAILLIHHVRKMPDADPFNMISGSTGIAGSADTMYILEKAKRVENKAVLHVTGRDVEDMQLELEFDRDSKVWQFISFLAGEEKAGERFISAVAALLSSNQSITGTASELADALKAVDRELNFTPNRLSRMLKENSLALEKRHGITMEFSRTNSARAISLAKGDGDDTFTHIPPADVSSPVPKPSDDKAE